MATPAAFQVQPINNRKRIPTKTIRALARHIAQNFDPKQIILFGSHAHGKPTAWSDVDLLVVMDTPEGEEMDAILKVADSLPDLSFKVDIIVIRAPCLKSEKNWAIGSCAKSRQRGRFCMNELTKEWVDKVRAAQRVRRFVRTKLGIK
ncbi:MAG: nucleotidyltransferase domain-containing protein [Chloroflexi bacterium]|nr:nucleotidyltransferase domain-containing protein [Chloroflexota bacterium]